MGSAKRNFAVDLLMGAAFLAAAATGLVIFFFLPSGAPQSGFAQFLGVIKRDWTFVHEWAGLAVIVFVLLHLALHWRWLLAMAGQPLRMK